MNFNMILTSYMNFNAYAEFRGWLESVFSSSQDAYFMAIIFSNLEDKFIYVIKNLRTMKQQKVAHKTGQNYLVHLQTNQGRNYNKISNTKRRKPKIKNIIKYIYIYSC